MKLTFACVLVLTCGTLLAQALPRVPGFSDLFDRVRDRISGAIGNLDNNLSNLMNNAQDFNRRLEDVAKCYRAQLGNRELNIFNSSLSFRSIIEDYYQAFPENPITPQSIRNLLDSTRDIISRCLNRSDNSTTQYGYTELSDKSDEEIQSLLGYVPPQEQQVSRRKRMLYDSPECEVDKSASLPSSFDWRDRNVVTPPRNQRSCGSCWAFAAAGAIESGWLIQKEKNGTKLDQAPPSWLDLSEQELVNCAKSNGCHGGNYQAYEYAMKNGVNFENNKPYVGREQTCSKEYKNPLSPVRDFCVKSKYIYRYGERPSLVDEDTMQRALVQKGPLYISINADPLQYRNVRGGVVNERGCSTQTNHAVLLVGYTPNSWIIKNSWGTNWGDGGFFELARGSNMCGVNTEISWPIMKEDAQYLNLRLYI